MFILHIQNFVKMTILQYQYNCENYLNLETIDLRFKPIHYTK